MRYPDLAILDLLVAVCDEGSLSAGARAVGMAQPNASRSLARLERTLGLPLLIRSTTGATLTTEGLMVVELARSTLESARALEAGVTALRADASSRLSVMASQTVAEHLLPAWIAEWQRMHGPSGILAAVGNTRAVLEAVRAGTVALGFIEGPGAPRGLNSTIVATDDLVLVVAPEHAWSGREGITGDELAGTPLLTREPGSGTRIALSRALAPRTLAEPALELASNAAVRVSASAGTAPAVLSRLAITDALTTRTLVEVSVRDVDLRRNLRAVWGGPQRLANPAAAALVSIAAAGHRKPST